MSTSGSMFFPCVQSAKTATMTANAGMTLAFEPCMDCSGYPVVEEVSLARRRWITSYCCLFMHRPSPACNKPHFLLSTLHHRSPSWQHAAPALC